jgi:hypothetical protein
LLLCCAGSSTEATIPTYRDAYLGYHQGPEPTEPDAARLARQLIDWLGITYQQLAGVTGISRSAFFHWRNATVTPRGSKLRPLLRVHSLVSLLVKRFGVDGARRWLHSNGDSWNRLLDGDIDGVEHDVRLALLGKPDASLRRLRSIVEEVEIDVSGHAARPLRRSSRSATKGRLVPRD